MKSAVVGLTNTPKLSRRNSNISNLSYISGLSKSQQNAAIKAKMAQPIILVNNGNHESSSPQLGKSMANSVSGTTPKKQGQNHNILENILNQFKSHNGGASTNLGNFGGA